MTYVDAQDINYNDIQMLPERGRVKPLKLMKLLWCLETYPDVKLAMAFARVGNIRSYLPYWIGREQYNQIQADIKERKKAIWAENLLGMLRGFYAAVR